MLNDSLALTQRIPPGVRFMLLSALGFALMGACVKALGTAGIPVLEIVAARSLVSLVISYADIRRKHISPWGHRKSLLVLRGVLGALALMAVFYSVTTLPLAQATVLQYTYPTFTAILALIFLKERIQWATMACIGLSLLGLIVVSLPQWDHSILTHASWWSLGAALLGAFGSGSAYVVVRRLSRTEDSSVIIFYFPMIALPISVLLLGPAFVMPTWEQVGLMLLVGIFTQIGQIGLTKAMAVEQAGKASAYAYIQVIFSTLLGFLWFGEIPTLWTLLGGVLIIAGALINTLWKR